MLTQAETRLSLKVRSVAALLDAEGSPLCNPRIHPEAAEELWWNALKHGPQPSPLIEIAVPADEDSRQAEVQQAVREHFNGRAQKLEEELRGIFRNGWSSLGIGLLVVAGLFALAEGILLLNRGPLLTSLSESLIIIAWVALWHPAELLLYAHFPVRRQLQMARNLVTAEVSLQPTPKLEITRPDFDEKSKAL